jgi:hypothetical protein
MRVETRATSLPPPTPSAPPKHHFYAPLLFRYGVPDLSAPRAHSFPRAATTIWLQLLPLSTSPPALLTYFPRLHGYSGLRLRLSSALNQCNWQRETRRLWVDSRKTRDILITIFAAHEMSPFQCNLRTVSSSGCDESTYLMAGI